MGILQQMLDIRRDCFWEDCKEAMQKLVHKLHYEVAPRVKTGDSFMLFASENDKAEFCKDNGLDIRALNWLIREMRSEGLITSGEMPVFLSPLGVEKFCMESAL